MKSFEEADSYIVKNKVSTFNGRNIESIQLEGLFIPYLEHLEL